MVLLFLLVPYSLDVPNSGDWFPFVDDGIKTMPLRSYVWMLFEKISWIVMYYIIYTLIHNKYKMAAFAFLIMEGLRFVEFTLNYNSAWIDLYFIKIGLSHIFITFKITILGVLIWNKGQ
jgi:Na+-translocating ferredoxin:NAD+ oxidoreductase RnfA subunit